MQILFYFCLLLIFGSVLHFYKRFLHIFLGFLMIDCAPFLKFLCQYSGFGCWFLVFGRFPQVCNHLGLFLMLGLGFKVLPCVHRFKGLIQIFREFGAKSSVLKNGFYSRSGIDEVCGTNVLSGKWGALKLLMNSNPPRIDNFVESKVLVKDVSEEIDDDGGGEEKECYVEDDEIDVIELRKLIKLERNRANAAVLELEKERVAAASAVEELMAKILCLKNEKNSIEIQSNQNRRLAELKQQYDDEVIRYLKWIIMNLEDQLEFCGEKLDSHGKDNEMDQYGGDADASYIRSRVKDGRDDVLISSLERHSSAPL